MGLLNWYMIAGLDLSLFVSSTQPLDSPQIYGSVKANSGISSCTGHLRVWGHVVPGSETHFRDAPSIHHVLPAFAYVLVCSEAKRALLSLRPSTQGCTVSTFLLLGLSERPLQPAVAMCILRVSVPLPHLEPGKWLSSDFLSYVSTSNVMREVLGPSEEPP